MPKSILDTDIFSEVTKRRNPIVEVRALAYEAQFGRFSITVVTVVEVVMGHHQAGSQELAQHFMQRLSALEVLSLDVEAAEIAGAIHADLRRIGRPIGWADPLIAAIALRQGRTLVTGNTDHYAHIQALGYPLRLDNWRQL